MKLDEFKGILKKNNIDAVLLLGRDGIEEYNIRYFCDMYPRSACRLWISSKDSLLVPALEMENASQTSKIPPAEMKMGWYKNLRAKTIGFNGNYISVNELKLLRKNFPDSKFVDIAKDLEGLREIKTVEEIERTRIACELTDQVLEALTKKISKMKTELDTEKFILDEIKSKGVDPSFAPIVASTNNSSKPHHYPSKKGLKGFCVIDIGVKYKGYCSDITRTFYIGTPKKEEVNAYNSVLKSQLEGIKLAKDGILAEVVDSACRNSLGSLAENFIHSTGHSVGLEIHDVGVRISKNSKTILKKNMIITVEPGIYFKKKFGIRIEDTVLVKDNFSEPLTKFPKKLLIFKK